jgi:predicted kinase
MNKLYIFCGIPFSGKTTIAKELEKAKGFKRIDLDEIKFSIFGNNIEDEQVDKDGWDKVYKNMYKEIEDNLKEGKTVVNDTGNFTKNERSLVKNIADRLGVETVEVFIDTPVEVARQRWMENKKTIKRFDVSDKDMNLSINEMEPPLGKEVITYKYPQPINRWIANNFQD